MADDGCGGIWCSIHSKNILAKDKEFFQQIQHEQATGIKET